MRTVIKPGEYTFDASAKKINFLTVGTLVQEFILGIWNATAGVKIYDPHAAGYGGTVATPELTLTFDTTAMADSDTLLIFYEDPTVLASELLLGNIYGKLSGDPSTETTLAAILAKIIAAPSTEAKQDAIISLLNALGIDQAAGNAILAAIAAKDFATEATVADILAKIIAAPATEAKQDAGNTLLTTIAGKDFATQTTVAAILAKIIAAPATEAKQDAGNASLVTIAAKDFATQTTLAAILVKLADPATETTLAELNTAFGTQSVGTALTPTQTAPLMALFKLLGTNIASMEASLSGASVAEDVASANADKALRVLSAIRKAIPANTSNADGDYEFLQMSAGALWVALASALPAGTNNIGDVDVLTVPADPFGANADAIVAAGATGSIQAKLRRMTQGLEDLKTLIVLAAGTAVIGKVGIDQTTPGTTNNVEVSKLPKASSANTVSAVATGTGDIIASNSSRKGWGVQNCGTNPLFIYMKTGASSTVFHKILPGGVADSDGRGGSFEDTVYTGVVSITGTSPKYTFYEY